MNSSYLIRSQTLHVDSKNPNKARLLRTARATTVNDEPIKKQKEYLDVVDPLPARAIPTTAPRRGLAHACAWATTTREEATLSTIHTKGSPAPSTDAAPRTQATSLSPCHPRIHSTKPVMRGGCCAPRQPAKDRERERNKERNTRVRAEATCQGQRERNKERNTRAYAIHIQPACATRGLFFIYKPSNTIESLTTKVVSTRSTILSFISNFTL